MDNSSTSEMFRAACAYIEMGWALIPVEGLKSLDSDECLCGKYPCGLGNKNAGKHPASGRMGWQNGPKMTVQEAYHTFEEDCPDYNMGARTGDASGFFAVDVEAEGLPELAELEAIHGKLPKTRVHRTGSGGKHFLFKMPDFDVRNSQKKLTSCIDIRGNGGMIVLPPSVSAKGAYGVEDDSPIADAPEWLLEWLRNRLRSDGPNLGEMPTVEDLPTYSELTPERQQQCQKYALAVIEREAARYRDAPPGTGNAELFNAACNILEIVQSPWNLYTYDHANQYLEKARSERMALNPGRGQDRDEFIKTLMSARSTTIGKGRALPPDRSESLMFDVPFTQAGSDSAGDASGVNDPFMNPDGSTAPGSVPPGEKPLRVKPKMSAMERLRSRMHNRSELDGIAPPTPLIERVMDVGTMVVLSGQFGTFKTFTTIGWACSIATGTPWLGHEVVTPGPVLYIAAEGASGIKLRVAAWEKDNGVRVPDEMLTVIDIPVNLGDDAQVTAAVTIARELGARLIIFDTLHRCTTGMDGDDNSEMGKITQVADTMREHANNITTLYVHHTGHAGTRSRGASSIEDDADCVWITKLTAGDTRDPSKPRMMEQRKTKDSPLLDPFFVKFEAMDGTDSGVMVLVDEHGMPIGDEVAGESPFMPIGRPVVDAAEMRERIEGEVTGNAALVLNIFMDIFGEHGSGVTEAKIRAACKEAYKDRGGWGSTSFHRTFGRAWGRLEREGIIEQNGNGRWIVIDPEERLKR